MTLQTPNGHSGRERHNVGHSHIFSHSEMQQVSGHEAAHGWRWRRRGRHGPRTPALQPVHRLIAPVVKLS